VNYERDWYGRDWVMLRTQLIKLCLLYSDPLLSGLQHAPTQSAVFLVDQFMKRVREEIGSRIPLDQLGLWQSGLSLLVHEEWLCSELEHDQKALCGRKIIHNKKIKPCQALARKLAMFFEKNRRMLVADELGVSSNRVKTWERLDKISRTLNRTNTSTNRCTEDHFEELANYVRRHYGHDRNLPRRAKTIKGYFYTFSKQCIENIENYNSTMDKLSMQEAGQLLQGVGMAELSRCIKQLSKTDKEIISVSFKLNCAQVVYLSLEDYLNRHNLQEKQFEQKRSQVVNRLRRCLEISLVARQGGHG